MAVRAGLWDGRMLTLFPRRLTNTAKSATRLQGMDYATRIVNITPNNAKAGSGKWRYGLSTKGDAISGETITETIEYRKSDGTLQILVYTDAGKLYTLNESTGAYTSIKTGLDTNGTLYWQAFNSKLVFCNGVDNNFSWDGSTCTDFGEYVTDYDVANDVFLGSTPAWVSTSSFTIVRASATPYANGTPIRVTFATTGAVTATVSGTSGSGTITVTVTGTPFPSSSETINKVEYWDEPPAFSYLFAEHDILFALSGGTLHPTTYRGTEGLKVFYTDSPNNENAWFNQTGDTPTQELNFFNIENKARVFDELLAISSIDGNVVFHGRKQTYLYVGSDPSDINNWQWQKTIPVGIVHGKLLQHLPSDVLFCTKYGFRTLRNAFATETLQISADIGSDIEGDVKEKVATLTGNVTSYRKARSFWYDYDGFYGFKMDDESLLVYWLNEDAKGWLEFTGLFAGATAFLGTTDGRLLVGNSTQLYVYGNGTDSGGGTVYSDNGAAIEGIWESPWLSLGGGSQRWSNRGFEIIMEEAQTGTIGLTRYINTNTRNSVETQYTVTVDGALWDVDMWDVAKWDGDLINPVGGDKFLCDDLRFKITLSTTTGPFSILAVSPIGR